MGLLNTMFGTQPSKLSDVELEHQYMKAAQANAARNSIIGGSMGGGGFVVSGSSYPAGGLAGMQQAKPLPDPRKWFCVEPVENGYVIEVKGKKYYAEDKAALGGQITTLMTMLEVQDD